VAPLTFIFFLVMFIYLPVSQCKKHRKSK
jgi:hypothetical protein